jgi:hypothetical protein
LNLLGNPLEVKRVSNGYLLTVNNTQHVVITESELCTVVHEWAKQRLEWEAQWDAMRGVKKNSIE